MIAHLIFWLSLILAGVATGLSISMIAIGSSVVPMVIVLLAGWIGMPPMVAHIAAGVAWALTIIYMAVIGGES